MSDPCKFVGVVGEQCDRLHQVLASPRARGKRAPSFYNLYVKACLASKGGIKKFGEAAPKMRECSAEYKEDKRKGQFRYKVEVPPSVSGSSPQLWKGRDLQAEWHDLYRKVSGKGR